MITLTIATRFLIIVFFVFTDSTVAHTTIKTTFARIETTKSMKRVTSPENLATTENAIMTTVTYPGNFMKHKGVMRGERGALDPPQMTVDTSAEYRSIQVRPFFNF